MGFRRFRYVALVSLLAVFVFPLTVGWADSQVSGRWQKTREFSNSEYVGKMSFAVTYFSSEYIQAEVMAEAEKNLWTADEMENYKYQYLKTLRLDECIPFFIRIVNNGPSMHMAPFGDQFTLWIGKKKYKPVDYDKRFNFSLTGEREGFVYFQRYDEETGDSLLDGVNTIRLVVNSGISAFTIGAGNFDFLWDIGRDNPESLGSGKAAEKLEADRLIKRLKRLNDEKSELESQLDVTNAEIQKVETRLAEIQQGD